MDMGLCAVGAPLAGHPGEFHDVVGDQIDESAVVRVVLAVVGHVEVERLPDGPASLTSRGWRTRYRIPASTPGRSRSGSPSSPVPRQPDTPCTTPTNILPLVSGSPVIVAEVAAMDASSQRPHRAISNASSRGRSC